MWDNKVTHQIEWDFSLAPGSGSQMKCVRGESITVHSKRTKVKDADDDGIKQGMETVVTTNLTPAHFTIDDTSVSLDYIRLWIFALLVTHYYALSDRFL